MCLSWFTGELQKRIPVYLRLSKLVLVIKLRVCILSGELGHRWAMADKTEAILCSTLIL